MGVFASMRAVLNASHPMPLPCTSLRTPPWTSGVRPPSVLAMAAYALSAIWFGMMRCSEVEPVWLKRKMVIACSW